MDTISIKSNGMNIDVTVMRDIMERYKSNKRDDVVSFVDWHGTTNLNKAFTDDVMDILYSLNFQSVYSIEAKIVSGELPNYPFEDRTTKDGWVGVDDFKLDDYHRDFLTIGNEFRVTKRALTIDEYTLEKNIETVLNFEQDIQKINLQ